MDRNAARRTVDEHRVVDDLRGTVGRGPLESLLLVSTGPAAGLEKLFGPRVELAQKRFGTLGRT